MPIINITDIESLLFYYKIATTPTFMSGLGVSSIKSDAIPLSHGQALPRRVGVIYAR